jgi:phosphatidylserine/phosphatidylglycerophosphate/cardiolipin synthase-like enzyme
MPKLSQGILAYAGRHVKKDEWREWLETWGVASEAIYLPTRLASELRAIKPPMGVGFEWEVISELVKSYQGSRAEAILVTSEDEIEAKMAEVIAGAKKELVIMCRAFDETLFPALAEAWDRGVVVKIVTVPTQRLKQEKYPEIGRLEEALKKASVKIQVKTNAKQHARVIISECAALVGSADPDYYGVKVHRNACVYTTNPTVVNAAKLFFESVWQESEG